MSNTGYRPLSQLPRLDPSSGEVTVVIETPKGSPNKYDYDESSAAFRLAAVMPEGTTFPYDFGFIPSTLGEDGDPLDVLVLLDAPAVVGCVLTVRLIGLIQAEQRVKGENWLRNDRLLAVATHAHTHEQIQTIDDLRPRLLDQIEGFFCHYNEMNGKEFKPLERGGPKQACRLVDQGATAFEAKQGRSDHNTA